MARVFRIIRAALSLFLLFAGAFPALAQQQTPQSVSVRANAQGADHVRVVFDWPTAPGGYTLAEEKGKGLVVVFNAGAGVKFDFSAAAAIGASVYDGAQTRAADPPTVFLKTGSLNRFRYFRAGNRIIVDL